jgi:AcrR family transcriptional regulator
MSTISDARVVRTRDALRQAMTQLATESPLEAITVRAIAARAGVGYATFFRHYPDKDALLADVADRLIREFLQRVAPLLTERDRAAAARTMCDFVMEHLAIYQALMAGGSGETVRAEMLRQTMKTMAATRKRKPDGPFDDLMLFHLVSAILNLLTWWLRHLDEIDAETMAEIIERTVLTPVVALRLQPPAKLRGPSN